MRTVPRLLGILLVFAAALAVHAPDSTEMAEDFAWFSSLGFPDVKGLTFIRYVSGTVSSGDDPALKPVWNNAWLIADGPHSCTVRTLNFELREASKTIDDPKMDKAVERVDLRNYAESQLIPHDRTGESQGFFRSPTFSPRAELFVLAWMCSRQGLDEVAARLYTAATQAKGMPRSLPTSERGNDDTWPFRKKLERDLAIFEIWRITMDFEDLKVSRRQLLERLQAFPKRFPQADYLALAAEWAGKLAPMVAEDQAHPLLTVEQIAKLSPDEQAKEWIFRLRDENIAQCSSPGSVVLFDGYTDHAPGPKSPAHQLAELGDAAIPALIEALGDHRLTRCVGFNTNYFMPRHVLTIRDAALQTIEKISRSDPSISAYVKLYPDQDMADFARAGIETWWKKHLAKGPLAELSEATARGDLGSAEAGAELLKRFPKDAAGPIIAGAAAASQLVAQYAFIKLVSQLKDDRGPDFLLREVREGRFLDARAEAAERLTELGRLEGISILAQVWETTGPSENFGDATGRERVIEALGFANSPEGFHALARGLRGRTPACRRAVLEALLPANQASERLRLAEDSAEDKPAPDFSDPTKTAMEDLLGAELEDNGCAEDESSYEIKPGVILRNPRLCDLAAMNLAERWADKYTFDPMASFADRDRQRVIMLNTFRSAHGLPALALPPSHPAVASEESGKITEVQFAGGTLKAPEAVRALLRGAKGRAIDRAFFEESRKTFVESCASQTPPQDEGFILFALRENEHTGITLLVSPAERARSEKKQPRAWQITATAAIAGQDALFASEHDVFGAPPGAADGPSIESVVDQLRALPPEEPFELKLEIAPERLAEDYGI